jgi:DNA-binding transcriptional regulator YhcF (GntR family)
MMGLVEGRQGVGTFVTSRPAGPPPSTHARLARRLEQWVRTARAEGLDDLAIEALYRSSLRRQAEDVA